jgi:hypothetical protein
MYRRSRMLAVLFSGTLLLGLAGLGVVEAGPSVGAQAGARQAPQPPRILSVSYTPNAAIFSADAPVHVEATVRVQVDRTGPWSLKLSQSGLRDPSGFFGGGAFLLIADSFTAQSDVDTVHLTGDIPNVLANGALARSVGGAPNFTFSPQLAYLTSAGGGYIIGPPAGVNGALPVVSDQRVRIDAPNTITKGDSLTVKAVSESFKRAWVPEPAALQLQFQSDGTGAFTNQGGPVQTGQDGNAVFTVAAVGSPGDWRVVTTAPPGGRTITSNQVHVGFAANPPPAPSAPIVTFNKATTTSLFFNITAPAVGAPIDHYEWTWTPADGGGTATSQPGTSPFEITGLTAGTHYDVTVKAVNAAGPGEAANASGTTEVVPPSVDVPGVPSGVKGKAGNHEAKIRWKAPSTDGGSPVTRYVIHRFKRNKTVSGSARSVTFRGLRNNATYTFFVKACNKAGCGPFSKPGVAVRPHS